MTLTARTFERAFTGPVRLRSTLRSLTMTMAASPLTCALAILLPFAAHAQKLGWSTTIEASGNMLFGNAQDRLFAGRLQVGRADSTLEVRSDARFTYAESTDDDGKPNVEAVADVHVPRHVRQRFARPWRGEQQRRAAAVRNERDVLTRAGSGDRPSRAVTAVREEPDVASERPQ